MAILLSLQQTACEDRARCQWRIFRLREQCGRASSVDMPAHLTDEEREKIDTFIRERGVTMCPPFGERSGITAASDAEVVSYWRLDGGSPLGRVPELG